MRSTRETMYSGDQSSEHTGPNLAGKYRPRRGKSGHGVVDEAVGSAEDDGLGHLMRPRSLGLSVVKGDGLGRVLRLVNSTVERQGSHAAGLAIVLDTG
jgi:hypothetical protein